MIEYTPEPRQDLLHDALDGAIEPWYTPAEIRFPDAVDYDPLARLWQAEEFDERTQKRKEAFDLLENHVCNRTIDAIVDGKRRKICDICLDAHKAISSVLIVHDSEQEYKEAA